MINSRCMKFTVTWHSCSETWIIVNVCVSHTNNMYKRLVNLFCGIVFVTKRHGLCYGKYKEEEIVSIVWTKFSSIVIFVPTRDWYRRTSIFSWHAILITISYTNKWTRISNISYLVTNFVFTTWVKQFITFASSLSPLHLSNLFIFIIMWNLRSLYRWFSSTERRYFNIYFPSPISSAIFQNNPFLSLEEGRL